MTVNPFLAGMEEALAQRDLALERVEASSDEEWRDRAYAAVHLTCTQREQFISDDIWAISQLDSTREDRALGPVMLRAARAGLCVKTDRVRPSTRSHGSGKPVWRSLIYKGRDV